MFVVIFFIVIIIINTNMLRKNNYVTLLRLRNLFCFQAISLKESQLVGNVTTNIEDTTEDASSPVRIIAPKEEVLKDSPEDDSDSNQIKFSDSQDVQISSESQENLPDDKEIEKLLGSLSTNTGNENNIQSSLSQISSYEEFIEHIDQKLREIETELVAVLNVSVLVLDSEERPKNLRWQQTMELLESIHDIRQRYTYTISVLSKNNSDSLV
jgi:hypothetical protein